MCTAAEVTGAASVSQTARLVGIEFELGLGGRFGHACGPSKQRGRIPLIAPMG